VNGGTQPESGSGPGKGRLPVTFLSDFGYEDEFAGVCRIVIERRCPGARVIDVTHDIPPGDVRRGALALHEAVSYSPPAVHLAVVDPGVGTPRRAVAVAAGGHFLVGPDNGLLALAVEAAGRPVKAFEVSRSPVRLEPVSRTFHGRDLFSPVAAALASGVLPADLGDPVDPDSLEGIGLPAAVVEPDRITAHVLYADRFGNLVLDAGAPEIAGSFLQGAGPGSGVRVETGQGTTSDARFGVTFGDAAEGGAVLFADSSGRLSLALNRGDAADRFALGRDDTITISPA
jgi:S-adenosyl-L-methionine hydrolase (adenosine-forming)